MSSFATSYIPTTGTAATRSADSATMTGTSFSSWYRQDQGTFVADFIVRPLDANKMVFSVDDGTSINRTYTIAKTDGVISAICENGGVQQFSFTSGIFLTGAAIKTATAFESNNSVMCTNGTPATPDTQCTPAPASAMRFGVSVSGAASSWLNSTIARIRYWPKRLPNATLQKLTSP